MAGRDRRAAPQRFARRDAPAPDASALPEPPARHGCGPARRCAIPAPPPPKPCVPPPTQSLPPGVSPDWPPAPRSESTRLNSSHVAISYAVFCLKKKKKKKKHTESVEINDD